ncbi:MAG: hypothetical protein AAF358_14170 [Pseudomonadota bacterium]
MKTPPGTPDQRILEDIDFICDLALRKDYMPMYYALLTLRKDFETYVRLSEVVWLPVLDNQAIQPEVGK